MAEYRKETVTKADYDKKSPLDTQLEVIKKEHDPRFGDCIRAQNRTTGQVYVIKEKLANSKAEADRDILNMQSRMRIDHPHIQKMIDWSSTMKSGLCSKNWKIRGYYEWPETDLAQAMRQLHNSKQQYSHEDLTHMAYQMLDALCF